MSSLMSDTEQQELIQGFVEESREMMEEVEPLLIELEKRSDESGDVDPEVVNTIFRLFHSLKGGAGFLGFSTVGSVTHVAETLLDLFRKGNAKLDSGHVDTLIRTTDFIRQLLDNVEAHLDDKGYDGQASHLIEELQAAIDKINQGTTAPQRTPKKAKARKKETTKKTAPVSEGAAERKAEAVPSDLQLSITPEMVKQFTNEAEELLETSEEALLNLEKDPKNEEYVATAFRALHSFKGNSGYLSYTDLQKLSHHMENVLELIREGKIEGDSELFSLLLEILDSLRDGVAKIAEGKEPRIVGLTGWINLLGDSVNSLGETLEPEEQEEVEETKAEISTDDAEDVKVEQEVEFEPADSVKVPKEMPAAAPVYEGPERRAGEDRRSGDRRQEDRRANVHQTVRVDVEKLDSLLDLVGELVIAEAMVAQNPDIKGLDIPMDRFEKAVMQLEKISRDIQDIATSIRMIPLAGTFRRMIRLVRDLSQKAGKKVELELIGEETEVDKTVIEQINDPLVHIIRNAIDHGIEIPEERETAEKSPEGTVTLEAKYVGGEVWITVSDDGYGLDREKILQKANDRGLVSGDGAELRDEEVWQLIFQPGFSTADKVTDVSGRGVGMDVVKRNIENIRGKVDIRSEAGRGSAVILRIPLTLAIIDGMLVRVGDIRYTLPLVAIRESLQPSDQDITRTPDGNELANIRGRLIPVVRLHNLFEVKPEHEQLSDGIIIVVENRDQQVCLFVDEQLGQQQIVIKGLSDYIGTQQCVSGCTILGDGEISLIIDIAGVINTVLQASSQSNQQSGEESRNSSSQGDVEATL
jgi:two-component system chemotaxis sensor kinase CheA